MIVVISIANASKEDTYHYAIWSIFDLGNQLWNNPGNAYQVLKNEEAQKFVYKQYKAGNLTWSNALSWSCRDLVLDIGPNGLLSHTTSQGKNEFQRL